MSEATGGGFFSTIVFNPALLRKDDLVRGFVARKELLERLLDDLRRAEGGAPPQHQLLIGQRGLGKTTLLRRLAFGIEDDPQLSAAWIPLAFPEEQYNVKNLGDFWLNCADALSDALDRNGDRAGAEALDQKVAGIPAGPQRSSEALALLVSEAERLKHGLVLLVDNLDIVLDRLNHEEEWAFRRAISNEHRLYFIGASSRIAEALYEHGRAFYEYFQVHELKGLSEAEMFAVLESLAREAGDERVLRLIRDKPSRVRALRVLTGGNPRTTVLLYRVLSQGADGDVERDLEQLLDLYTPLYKARFEEFAPQSRQVVDAMAIHWDPVTAGVLAEKLAPLSVSQVSAHLNRLESSGVVEKAAGFEEAKTSYLISERFFNIWYLMRASRRVRRQLIWLVKFHEAWFGREEIRERARHYLQRDPKIVGSSRYVRMTLAYSQSVDDPYLRRNLESAAFRASLDSNARGQFDFSDLPQEVLDRNERMELLSDLRDRVLRMRLEGVDSEELWRVLGGSPHLRVEEKKKVVEELMTLDREGVRQLFVKLTRDRYLLERLYHANSSEVGRLFDALATGEMADVYDVEGSLAVASRWGCDWLPIIAISSGINPGLNREKLSESELSAAEAALRALTTQRGLESRAWNGLGNLFMTRLDRYEDAEKAFRRAIELDPSFSYPWNNLGRLLAYYFRDRYDEAEDAFRRAIELDPQDALPWTNLGDLLQYRLGRYVEAEEAYQEAINLDPLDADTWDDLGNLFQDHLNRYTDAENAYRRAVEIDPGNSYPWGNLGRLIEKDVGRQEEALAAFVRASELDPTDPIRARFALPTAQAMGNERFIGPALKGVSRLNELFPEDAEISLTLSGLLALSGDWVGASLLFTKVAASEHEQPDAWAFGAFARAGFLDGAIALLEETGACERWRPLYEAMRAIRAGSAAYLRRINPEVRIVAEMILARIAPELPKSRNPQRSKKRNLRSRVS